MSPSMPAGLPGVLFINFNPNRNEVLVLLGTSSTTLRFTYRWENDSSPPAGTSNYVATGTVRVPT
jgi:hypothetical protein